MCKGCNHIMLFGALNHFWIVKQYFLYQQINPENKPIWSLLLQGSDSAWGTLQPLCPFIPDSIFRETLWRHWKSDCYLSTNTTEQRKTATLVLIRHSCFSCYWLFTHGTWNIGISRTSILWENLAPNVVMLWFVIVQMLHLYCNWESLYNPAAGLKNKIKLNYVNTTSHLCSTLHPNSPNMNWPNTGSFCPRTVTVLLNPLCRQEKTSHSETKRPTRTILLVKCQCSPDVWVPLPTANWIECDRSPEICLRTWC